MSAFSRRIAIIAIFLFAFASLAPSTAAESLTPDQKAETEQIIHDYLLQHPDLLIDSIRAARLQAEEKAAADAQKAIVEKQDALLFDPGSPVGGNPKGDVTLVEFFDYRCPYCKQVDPSLEALLKADQKLRIVYKEFPVLGPASITASRVALAARKQGKYDQFHRAMMAAKGEIDDDAVMRVARSIGLDMARIRTDMAAPEIDQILKNNLDLALALGVEGTPVFVVGDTMAPGAADIDSLRKLIASARKRG